MDWSDHGISIELLAPHERVRQMLWFQEFFDQIAVDRHLLRADKSTLRFKTDDAQHSRQLLPISPRTNASIPAVAHSRIA
jgi:hypothetical protein